MVTSRARRRPPGCSHHPGGLDLQTNTLATVLGGTCARTAQCIVRTPARSGQTISSCGIPAVEVPRARGNWPDGPDIPIGSRNASNGGHRKRPPSAPVADRAEHETLGPASMFTKGRERPHDHGAHSRYVGPRSMSTQLDRGNDGFLTEGRRARPQSTRRDPMACISLGIRRHATTGRRASATGRTAAANRERRDTDSDTGHLGPV